VNLKFSSDLQKAKEEIEKIHQHTKDSIEYASLIQNAILPKEELFKKAFKDYFIIWQPKDIVGGDVYLFEKIREGEYLLFVIDCTGHGVPGAFVTMIVKSIESELITNIVNEKEISPSFILSYFNKRMKQLLDQYSKDSKSNAGFDGGIVYINKKEKFIKYAGAETPLFYVEDNEVKMIKGSRHSVGYKTSDEDYEFKEHLIEIKEGMKFYITSDGYIDQNGGEKCLPFGKKRFKKLIEEVHNKPMKDQKEIFLKTIEDWQKECKEAERNDDITVIGFEVGKIKES